MSSSSFFVFRFLYNPDYSYIMTAQDIQNYRSARMGLCKKIIVCQPDSLLQLRVVLPAQCLGFAHVQELPRRPVGLAGIPADLSLIAHHPPTRGSGKERIWGKWTCLERFFGATPICVVWKSAVQFTGQHRQLDPLANTSQIHQQSSSVESG